MEEQIQDFFQTDIKRPPINAGCQSPCCSCCIERRHSSWQPWRHSLGQGRGRGHACMQAACRTTRRRAGIAAVHCGTTMQGAGELCKRPTNSPSRAKTPSKRSASMEGEGSLIRQWSSTAMIIQIRFLAVTWRCSKLPAPWRRAEGGAALLGGLRCGLRSGRPLPVTVGHCTKRSSPFLPSSVQGGIPAARIPAHTRLRTRSGAAAHTRMHSATR